MKVLTAIPAFNEAQFIEQVVRNVSAFMPLDHILIVDDGSMDDTAARARLAGVKVASHAQNLGKGAAILTALFYARRLSYDWILFMDGDGQHPSERVPDFLREMERDRTDVLLGNRCDRKTRMPLHRQLSNGITSLMISLFTGRRIHDSQCGMRAFRLSSLHGMDFIEHGFQLESEMLIKLGRSHARLAEIEVETIYAGQSSSIRLATDTFLFLKLLLKSLWW